MISDKYKIIFVHIPRTAGHTISWCFDYDRHSKNKTNRHSVLEEYKLAYPKKFSKYFKFTFVRNPWARVLSAWYLKEYRHQDQSKIRKMFNEFVENELADRLINKPHHYRSQLYWLLDKNGKEHKYDYIGRSEPSILLFHINQIYKHLGLKPLKEIPKMGASGYPKNLTYRDFYDVKSERIVSELYKLEIEYLEYSF